MTVDLASAETDMHWNSFVKRAGRELSDGALIEFDQPFGDEHALTSEVARGLRLLFADSFHTDHEALCHHVVYRDGDEADKTAWTDSQHHKWIKVHGLNFVPDVVIRRTCEEREKRVLPVEVKLVTHHACSQSLATAIGQCVCYRTRYDHAILLVGVERRVLRGDAGLDTGPQSGKLRDVLAQQGISLIFRDVGARD